jgi:hypothetical protein
VIFLALSALAAEPPEVRWELPHPNPTCEGRPEVHNHGSLLVGLANGESAHAQVDVALSDEVSATCLARPDEPDLIVSIDRTHSPGAPLPAWPAEVRCELPHQTLVLAFPEEPDLDAVSVLFDVPGMRPVPLRAGVREQRVAMAGGAFCEVTIDDGRPVLIIDVPPPASQEAAASGLRCDLKRRHSPPLEVTVRVRNPM